MVKADRVYFVEFTVEGDRPFPVDMLRYDHCYPAHEADSAEITNSHRPATIKPKMRKVNLRQWRFERGRLPQIGRWESFGWRVIDLGRDF